jgi:hypothetical protein
MEGAVMSSENEHPQLRSRLGHVLRNCPGVDWRRQLDSKRLEGKVRGDLGLCDMFNSNGDLEGSGQVWDSVGIIVWISSTALRSTLKELCKLIT